MNCVGPFIQRFFSTVNTTALHYLQLVESAEVKSQVWKSHKEGQLQVTYGFLTAEKVVALNPALLKSQIYFLLPLVILSLTL